MGFFSRKGNSQKRQDEGNNRNSRFSPNASIPSKTSLGVKRANSTQAESLNLASTPLPKAPDPHIDPVGYLKSIYAIRERSHLVLDRAKANQLRHFDVDMSKFGDTVRFIVSIIKRDFEPDYQSIPSHGRWQHLQGEGETRLDQLLATWPSTVDALERTRRLLDLSLVSILLDTGADTEWQYKSDDRGRVFKRSEGLVVAGLEMFQTGLFSSDPGQPCQVNSAGLRKLTINQLANGLQVTSWNPIDDLEQRANLVVRLSDVLLNQEVFGPEGRPGNMLDYLLSHPSAQTSSVPTIPIPTLWSTLMNEFASLWPSTKTQIGGVALGDAWPCASMPSTITQAWENILPFHTLTQWLTYSFMIPMQRLANVHFVGVELMTGLPEYRNGGLLVDIGLLSLKPEDMKRGIEQYHMNATRHGQPKMEVVPLFAVDDDVVVEWRAVTVGFFDMLLDEVNAQLGLSGSSKLSPAQMLEAGTWKGGMEIAEVSRPNTKEPPIIVVPDGMIFMGSCSLKGWDAPQWTNAGRTDVAPLTRRFSTEQHFARNSKDSGTHSLGHNRRPSDTQRFFNPPIGDHPLRAHPVKKTTEDDGSAQGSSRSYHSAYSTLKKT